MTVTETSSLSTIATDPLRNFKFVVTMQPAQGAAINMGFMSVSGLNMTVDVIAYREGGYNTTTQKMPGQADFSPITFSHGVMVGKQQDVDWMKQLFTVIQGSGTGNAGNNFRYNVEVDILDHPVTASTSIPVKARFKIFNCWPTTLAWSDLDAGANQLFISQMSLAHEGFEYSLASGTGASEAPTF